MIKADSLLAKISDQMAVLKVAIHHRGLLQRFDLHKTAENFFRGFLSHVYGREFVNLNHEKVNHPAIDLGQKEMGLGIQITSDESKAKVQQTLDTAMKYGLYDEYPHIQILILGDKQGRYEGLKVDERFQFDPASDIFDFADLVKMLDKIETPQLESLSAYLNQELQPLTGDSAASKQGDSQSNMQQNAKFVVAQGLLRAVFRLRDQIATNRIVIGKTNFEQLVPQLLNAIAKLKELSVEAEVLWGRSIVEAINGLTNLAYKLVFAEKRLIRNEAHLTLEQYELLDATVYGDGNEPFGKRVADAVGQIEALTRDDLPQRS